jgi:hypothetical protein
MLTEDPNDYSIRVIAERSLNVRQISGTAVTRGGADISAAAMEHAVELWLKEMAYQLCDGFSVNTGWFTASVHVKGTVKNPAERYDSDRHTIVFEFHQGSLMRREIPGIEVEIVGVADTDGHVIQVVDVKTGSVNNLLTPGRNLRISGNKLKIAGDDASVGVYFRNADTATEVKVDPADIVINNPSELIVIIPELDKNLTWQLVIITQYGVGFILKAPRTVTFDRILTVS